MYDLYEVFLKLGKSKFRTSFKLPPKELEYLRQKGVVEIRNHAETFVRERLADARPRRDGSQTPYKGHPVFVAQHGSATCCRTCISKWHGIPKHIELNETQITHIVDAIILWLKIQNPED